MSIDDVVVLPFVPATATARCPSSSDCSAWERCSTVVPVSRARASSTLSWRIAEDATTVRTPSRRAGSKPTSARAPTARSAAITGTSLASLPETSSPRASMIRAMPDMPMPPMPRKCTGASSSAGGIRASRSKAAVTTHPPGAGGGRLVDQVGEPLVGVEHRGAAGGVAHGVPGGAGR